MGLCVCSRELCSLITTLVLAQESTCSVHELLKEGSDGKTTSSPSLGSLCLGVMVEGVERVTPAFSCPGLSLQWQGDWLVLSGGLGVTVRLDRSSSVSISVDYELQGQTQGLCGVYNGQPEGKWACLGCGYRREGKAGEPRHHTSASPFPR